MAAATTDGTEQDPQPIGDQTGDPSGTDTGEAGEEAHGLQDSKQEPGDNENGAEMDGSSDGHGGCGEKKEKPTPVGPGSEASAERALVPENDDERLEPGGEEEKSAGQGSAEPGESPGERREEQRDDREESGSSSPPPGHGAKSTEKTSPPGIKRRSSLEISSSDGEPLSRMDSEDSISSTLMDLESTASSGRSTPAMMNGHGGGVSLPGGGAKTSGYTCCWDLCQLLFSCSPDLAEHIRGVHVDGQRGGVFVCLWKGCKVYNTPSTSQSWLQRHMLTHSGDKPFKCVVGGCNATFASQGGLARHVPTHFSSQGSSKLANQSRVKEESPSKAGLNKRRKLKNKRRRSLPRPHDFFDAQTMDAIRHRAICLNLATHIESLGNGHSVVFHSTVIARRKEDSGKVKVLLHWTPEDILPDTWVNETERSQQKTKVVHLSQLPTDTTVLLDPNIYRMLF